MTRQQTLFDPPPNSPPKGKVPAEERFQGAMVFSAVGDALGWPTEFLRHDSKRKPPFSLPLREFVEWQKLVGGRWWGYRDDIGAGEYSDDTQLTLAVARSISSTGRFEPERFAYSEFPLWLHYERGGGRSIKTAARSLVQRKGDWLHNFYKRGKVDYHKAGANGAAMRNLPIALASCNDEARLIRDSFLNTIISHGHPRAILGTLLLGLAVRYLVLEEASDAGQLIQYLQDMLENAGRKVADDQTISTWITAWERKQKSPRGSFKSAFGETRQEALRFLGAMPDFLKKPSEEYYGFVGALEPSTKGSGLATTCTAIFLFLSNGREPAASVYAAASQIGSDTDTIASFVGALVGARYGTGIIPKHLWEGIQDREYLLKTASRLHACVSGKPREHTSVDVPLQQQEAYLRILAWEIGLHEMFWDAIDVGGTVVHPTLGRGVISSKEVRPIAREGYAAKLIRIKFDCGQSCVFHSRVENNDKVSESLGKDVEKALKK